MSQAKVKTAVPAVHGDQLLFLTLLDGAPLVEDLSLLFGWIRLTISVNVLRDEDVWRVALPPDRNHGVAKRTHGHDTVFQVPFRTVVAIGKGQVFGAELLFTGGTLGREEVQLVARFHGAMNAQVRKFHVVEDSTGLNKR